MSDVIPCADCGDPATARFGWRMVCDPCWDELLAEELEESDGDR